MPFRFPKGSLPKAENSTLLFYQNLSVFGCVVYVEKITVYAAALFLLVKGSRCMYNKGRDLSICYEEVRP